MDKAVDVRPGARWGRRIGIVFAVLILLLVVLYFIATSAAFLKGVILPRAGKSLNAQITVDDASISPFSAVTLKNFKLKTTGDQPLVSANEVRLRYHLMDIIKGHINVDEATLDTPTVSIVNLPLNVTSPVPPPEFWMPSVFWPLPRTVIEVSPLNVTWP